MVSVAVVRLLGSCRVRLNVASSCRTILAKVHALRNGGDTSLSQLTLFTPDTCIPATVLACLSARDNWDLWHQGRTIHVTVFEHACPYNHNACVTSASVRTSSHA